MAVLTEIRNRPWLVIVMIALGLLAFLVNPSSLDNIFGKNPNVLGKVNGEKITADEYHDVLYVLRAQAQQQGQPSQGLEDQAWQMVVQGKLIRQQFEKMGLELTEDFFYNQLQFDPLFAQNQENFDEKGNFRVKEIKKQVEDLKNSGNAEAYNDWLKMRRMIEYRMMARQVFGNVTAGVTTSSKEAEEMMRRRDAVADIDFVKIDYEKYLQKNPLKVSDKDLEDYIKKHPSLFKSEASRNLAAVHFPAVPSAADDAAALQEITRLASGETSENFANTTDARAYLNAYSDVKFNDNYLMPSQMPENIRAQMISGGSGTMVGPYKQDNLYVVSKLIDKKPSDSTLSRHILIAYSGSPAGQGVKRSREEAAKLADSIGAIVKASPARFSEFVNLSNDPGSAAQGGSLGWTTPQTPFVPEFQKFLLENSKGATGVVESQFGYHIINIEDKKAGAMTYQIANLVKEIKPSEQTEAAADRDAKRFIQQAQGKSFNDFVNLAKKSGGQFSNAKSVKRFTGYIQGLGTDKDEEIIAWAYDKKRKKGDTELFQVEGTGDRIVVYLNGKQDAGLADAESVRDQIEPIVKNELAAKKIIEKLGNTPSMDAAAKMFGEMKQTAQVNMLNPMVNGSIEPKVAGAAFGVAKGKTSKPVEGMTGVYLLVKKNETVNKQPGPDAKEIAKTLSSRNAQEFGLALINSLERNADIKDYRIEIRNRSER